MGKMLKGAGLLVEGEQRGEREERERERERGERREGWLEGKWSAFREGSSLRAIAAMRRCLRTIKRSLNLDVFGVVQGNLPKSSRAAVDAG